LMPNTKVEWRAALIGGLMAGLLWHLNNQLSVKFVSQLGRYKAVYGTLAALPVFMVGLYFFWLLLLFGAQVAHTYQNRRSYIASRLTSRVHQDGREWVAIRVMVEAARAFSAGNPAPNPAVLAERLQVPHQLMVQVTQTLLATRLAVEVGAGDMGLLPARPLDTIRIADILDALRRGVGQRPGTGHDAQAAVVERELVRVREAERQAGDRSLADLVRDP
ncbi:MAG: YihY/virulence factor BrkB family protein, partial [Verrucomicrobiales bacterium]|nr:YihY/virulence factor BrkB family protein [Verrucomicrobiales bacterium]